MAQDYRYTSSRLEDQTKMIKTWKNGSITLFHNFQRKTLSMILLFITAFISITLSDDNEYRLYRKLIENYNPLERPVANNSDAVKVYLGVVLQQIVDVVRLYPLFSIS